MGKPEKELRTTIIEKMASYLGTTTGSPEEQRLCDVYNAALPVEVPRWGTRNIKMINSPTWGWCALAVSCAAIETGMDIIVPIEIGVWEMVQIAKKFGLFQQIGNGYEPRPGDLITYEWKDPSIDPNHKWHVGVIEVVGANYFQTIDGNAGGGNCVRRTVARDDQNIWGFIAPDYASIAEEDPTPDVDTLAEFVKTLNPGDTVTVASKTDTEAELVVTRSNIKRVTF